MRDDFAPDGMGGIMNWSASRVKGGERAARLDEKGPDGKPVLRISGGNGPVYYSHQDAVLVPGETYRLSVKVRTHGLDPDARNEFEIYRSPWNWAGVAKMPADTKGAWTEISWEGELRPSRKDTYGITFYFSKIPEGGYADVSGPYFAARTEKGTQGVKPRPDTKPFKPRIIPVDPLLSEIAAEDAHLDFYFPGALDCPLGDCEVRAAVAGRTASATLGADRHAKVVFGKIPEGTYRLDVTVNKRTDGKEMARNEYQVIVRERQGMACGRRLNNFVTELRREPLKDGEYAFSIPRDGWVFVGMDKAHPGAGVDIDGDAIPHAIVCRAGEAPETMRRLKAGRHVATVRGVGANAEGATLSIRSVKVLKLGFGRMSFGKNDFNRFAAYNSSFHRRFGMYGALNTPSYPAEYDAKHPEFGAMLRARGCESLFALGLPAQSPLRYDIDTIKGLFMSHSAWKAGKPIIVDENSIGALSLAKTSYAEAVWDVGRNHRIDVCIEDAARCCYSDPARDIPELSAIVNAGDGTSYLVPEVYLRTPDDEAGLAQMMDYWRTFSNKARSLVPASPGRMIYMMGGWVWPGVYNTWCSPECDIKAFYDDFIRMLATDPAFADIGGIGFSTPACDEELFRFTVHAIRHYCVDGSDESISARHGLKLHADIMDNGDFTEGEGGLAGWTLAPAAAGMLTAGSRKGFGRGNWGQMRIFDTFVKPKKPWGDNYVTFVKSGAGANTLSRRLVNLVPGRLYEVTWCSYDTDAIEKRTREKTPETLIRAAVEGCADIPELAFTAPCDMTKYDKTRVVTVAHRIVFRATKAETTLRFTDDGAEAAPGARRSVNWIGARPFFLADESQLEDLKAFGAERFAKK